MAPRIKRERKAQNIMSDPIPAEPSALYEEGHPPSSGGTGDTEIYTKVHTPDNSNGNSATASGYFDAGQANASPDDPDQSDATTVVAGLSEDSPSGTSPGLEVLGRGVKQLVQAVQNLRYVGVEELALPLPKIVVVGDQSTGKSSLIEGISEIKVPRKAGVCTRCPLEINLTENNVNDASWSCVVSLNKKYMYDGTHGKVSRLSGPARSTNEGATRKRPLGPWVLQEAEHFIFAKTAKKEDVAVLLEWAQIATLNPQASHDEYKPQSGSRYIAGQRNLQVKFSPNVVRLEISGPSLPNLSFYDLPGVINVSDVPEEGYLVDLVKNLVKDYIKADSCINLLALPMTDDPANSSAFRLIRDEQAGDRTVGVLTKPDRVQEAESLEQWMQVLAGERFGLGHGYYVVKNNPDPIVDHRTARNQEKTFFAKNAPWSTILKEYDDRFGTLQLQTFLSQKLTAQIRASLPHIFLQVQRKLAEIDTKLSSLPEPPTGNLPRKIQSRLLKFEIEIQKQFEGGSSDYALPKEWHNLAESFRQVLANSRPVLILPSTGTSRGSVDPSSQHTSTPNRRQAHPSEPIPVDSGSDDDLPTLRESFSVRSGKKRVNQDNPHETPIKRMRMSDIPRYNGVDSIKKSYSKRFTLPDVRSILRDAHISLPNQIDPKATEAMIKESVQVWNVPLQSFLDSTYSLCQAMISAELQKAFSEWRNTLLDRQSGEISNRFLEQTMMDQRAMATLLLNNEIEKPMTLDVEAITAVSAKVLTLLETRRREVRAWQYLEKKDAEIERTPNKQNRSDRLAKVTDAEIGSDPYGQEVVAISNVKGYYDCAFSRFVDNICQSIWCQFFTKCRRELGAVLIQELRLEEADANEHCAILLAVNADDERERRQLLKEQEKLQKALSWLEGLTETEGG